MGRAGCATRRAWASVGPTYWSVSSACSSPSTGDIWCVGRARDLVGWVVGRATVTSNRRDATLTSDEVRIREQALPGVGHRFELVMPDGRVLVIVARRDGSREVAVLDEGSDASQGTVRLGRDQAVAVGSILLGARFAEGDLTAGSGNMDVGIADLTSASPAIGLIPSEIVMPDGAEAAVVAVARDDTPQLLEDDRSRRGEPGDRLVVAARGDRLDEVIAYLSG